MNFKIYNENGVVKITKILGPEKEEITMFSNLKDRPYQTYVIGWIRFSGKSSVHMSNMQHLQRQDAPGHIL